MNGDGTIDFEEFLEMMTKQSKDIDQTQEIKEAFKIFDRDGNGYIDAKELKMVRRPFSRFPKRNKKILPFFQVVTRMGEALTAAEADEFMREADINGDGKLDYDEFLKMMMLGC